MKRKPIQFDPPLPRPNGWLRDLLLCFFGVAAILGFAMILAWPLIRKLLEWVLG